MKVFGTGVNNCSNRTSARAFFVALGTFTLATATMAGPVYSVRDLGTLGGAGSYSYAINGSGQVVGGASTTGNITDHATLFGSSGTPSNTDLGTLSGGSSLASGINSAGK